MINKWTRTLFTFIAGFDLPAPPPPYLLTFKTLIGYFIELNWPRIILNWIYYWIELAKNNFELNIFWIESWVFSSDWIFFLNWILTIFFWIENWIDSFLTVFFWIKNWIESFSSEIQSLIESSNCTSHGYSGVLSSVLSLVFSLVIFSCYHLSKPALLNSTILRWTIRGCPHITSAAGGGGGGKPNGDDCWRGGEEGYAQCWQLLTIADKKGGRVREKN